MVRIGIIGFSGRDVPIPLTKDHYIVMTKLVKKHLRQYPLSEIILCSGGSAWSDHLVVSLFLEYDFGGLELYLPTAFINHKFDTKTSSGRLLNQLHQSFSEIVDFDSLGQLESVMVESKISVHPGFYARNKALINNLDLLIAFTTDSQIRGGTKNTWDQFKGEKIHHDISLFI